ncbi:MAG: hypothetical protein E5X07_33560 [Mesorhizobium sp.]|nr:MAG: hypothetical protein E5X07_33560 [Mesorhizobium sp.]
MCTSYKVYRVTTIARVAAELGEDEKWLSDIAGEMEPEDGLIRVYGPGDEETIAFGIEQLQGTHRQSIAIRPTYHHSR